MQYQAAKLVTRTLHLTRKDKVNVELGWESIINDLKVSELARLKKLQYQAAKLVIGALHLTSKDKLKVELGWESLKN